MECVTALGLIKISTYRVFYLDTWKQANYHLVPKLSNESENVSRSRNSVQQTSTYSEPKFKQEIEHDKKLSDRLVFGIRQLKCQWVRRNKFVVVFCVDKQVEWEAKSRTIPNFPWLWAKKNQGHNLENRY